MFAALDTLLARRNQRFICIDNGWPAPGPARHVAHLRHEVGRPLDEPAVARLRSQVGDLPELVAFYGRYGSLRLYCDTVEHPVLGHASAYYLAPPEEWADLKSCFEPWLDGVSDDELSELLPEGMTNVIVIGEVPNSGNYFLVPVVGARAGCVIAFDHDGLEFVEQGANLADFVNAKSTVTEVLLEEILAHTRYYDGVSDVSWLCREYRFDGD